MVGGKKREGRVLRMGKLRMGDEKWVVVELKEKKGGGEECLVIEKEELVGGNRMKEVEVG